MTPDEMKKDYGFRHAFFEAQHGFCGPDNYASDDCDSVLDDVVEVIASVEGENDGPSWVALVRLRDGRYCRMAAGCDFTGWDCQASGNLEFYATREELLSPLAITKEEASRLGIVFGATK